MKRKRKGGRVTKRHEPARLCVWCDLPCSGVFLEQQGDRGERFYCHIECKPCLDRWMADAQE